MARWAPALEKCRRRHAPDGKGVWRRRADRLRSDPFHAAVCFTHGERTRPRHVAECARQYLAQIAERDIRCRGLRTSLVLGARWWVRPWRATFGSFPQVLLSDRLRIFGSSSLGVLGDDSGDKVQVIAQENENVADADVQRWLQSVGVESRCQLEVLTFLHRHPITLLPPEYLARLLGYPTEPVVAALDSLSALQLLKWSAQSRGARSYQFVAPSVPSRTDALERLLALSDHRSGRLLLGKHLGRGDGTLHEERQAVRQFLDDANATLYRIRLLFGRSPETVQ